MKLGLIGCGNMGSVLLSRMISSNIVNATNARVFDIDEKKMNKLATDLNVINVDNIGDLVSNSDVVIIAVKPNNIEALLDEYRSELDKSSKIIVSIAAGVQIGLYRQYIGIARIVRVMPNTPALVGEGASGLYFDGEFDEAEHCDILAIFEACGLAVVVQKESLLDVVTGLSGSGPAYVFAFINSLADGAVAEGLPRDIARELAIQTVLGSAKLAKQEVSNGVHLEELKDRVTSPGGTTAEGLFALEAGGFRVSVMDAVRTASEKARKLGEK